MRMGPSRTVRESACTNCGKILDMVSVVDEKIGKTVPRKGDITICIKCGHVMVFCKHMKLRNPTGEEILKIAGDKRMVLLQQALSKLKGRDTL